MATSALPMISGPSYTPEAWAKEKGALSKKDLENKIMAAFGKMADTQAWREARVLATTPLVGMVYCILYADFQKIEHAIDELKSPTQKTQAELQRERRGRIARTIVLIVCAALTLGCVGMGYAAAIRYYHPVINGLRNLSDRVVQGILIGDLAVLGGYLLGIVPICTIIETACIVRRSFCPAPPLTLESFKK